MHTEKISALILSFNNETVIERCIKSLSFADEVVVIDSFSTDKTKALAESLGAKVHQHPFTKFGSLRNIALKKARYNWVFTLDTDEVATQQAINEMKGILASNDTKDVYFVPRLNTVFNRKLKYGGWYPDYRQPQFFKKDKMIYNEEDDVHEGYVIKGSIGHLKNYIHQFPFHDLKHYLEKMERYSTLMAKRMYENGKKFRWYNLIVNPFHSFLKRYFFRKGYKDKFPGFLLACLYSYYTFIKYAKLWEISKK